MLKQLVGVPTGFISVLWRRRGALVWRLDSWTSGMIGEDTVTLAGLTLQDQYFVAVNQTNTTLARAGSAGIFGLGSGTSKDCMSERAITDSSKATSGANYGINLGHQLAQLDKLQRTSPSFPPTSNSEAVTSPPLQLPTDQVPHLRLISKPWQTNTTDIQHRLVHHDVPPPHLVRLWTLARPICYSCSADFANVHLDAAKGYYTGWRECGDVEYW